MAKKQKEGVEQKANLYLLAIVAIVAIVGVVIMILNSGTTSMSLSESDLTGEALSSGPCPKAYSNGCSGIWTFVKSEGICTCITTTQVNTGGTSRGSIGGYEDIVNCCPVSSSKICTAERSQCEVKCSGLC